MPNIGDARAALAELKKSAAAEDKEHYETLSNALETIGRRINELENHAKRLEERNEALAQAVDRANGLAAGVAGYVAGMRPIADKVNIKDAKASANQLAPPQKMSAAVKAHSPPQIAENTVERIADCAKKSAQL